MPARVRQLPLRHASSAGASMPATRSRKPYVICHMMPSVDGRLRTDRWDIPETGHQEYERTANTYKADAWVCGRKTMEEFAKGRWRLSRRRTRRIPRADFVIPR